ncbi:RNA helicase [Bdellovibrio sp. ZAP7]|uniref:helicase-related protein n=1 Tax=Bdellovibrio sp. ZAP7 TaxID=2231053 RepID=UPI001156F851|nr:helicase-related protein [Bdellovibrio sp. ZAP7]QDK44631.1 RNA helicase [Bdellovibrio sp. ZAP7]
MAKLEDIKKDAAVKGILTEQLVSIVDTKWHGSDALEVVFRDSSGKHDSQILFRDRESTIDIVTAGQPWSFRADGALLKLASEAHRIRLAYLFDPLLAVHTSLVRPLPHQISAVYESMLPRQPLRFLLADDPGAGKTVMAGLLIKELLARGDLQRCLIVCPGSLVEQWQDELYAKFGLAFEILTTDKIESARTGNWFGENNLVICRLDKLSRNEELKDKLRATDWDLVVCDEAHKMSASEFGGEVKYTKRFQLGRLLSEVSRHFLLMTATPHNGKQIDFELFLSLLDGDRFEGVHREGVHASDPSDLMRRLVKEQLVTFEGTALFPERIAYTVTYELSELEVELYAQVTEYVRTEFNRADALHNDGRKGTVGFALTILQRRLASSPAAIHESLRRRRERLESRLSEIRLLGRVGSVADVSNHLIDFSTEDLEDLDELPEDELEVQENEFVDQATASKTVSELQIEIDILKGLEALAQRVIRSGTDRKWDEVSKILSENALVRDANGNWRKIIIFTEHRDTLNYLQTRIATLLGRPEAVVVIHGGVSREARKDAENRFLNDPDVKILIATDAAGEGVNLQRAHLMINYDLPWNPNRIEQRFGRIHRIGQTEVCHLWNLVAKDTREGDVYLQLLHKLEDAREALQGKVFDVLGKLTFDSRNLKDLMIEAIRYGDRPEVRARLSQVIDKSVNKERLQELLQERAIGHDTMDSLKVRDIRDQMERAEARKLQPHFVEEFFLAAFENLGGQVHERESRRFQINHVPSEIRRRDRVIGRGQAVLQKYERVAFDKELLNINGKPRAEFVCPGHALLDSTMDIILEKYRDLLKQGAVLFDENDFGTKPRLLIYLEHSIQDGRVDRNGSRRICSRRLQFIDALIEINSNGESTSGEFRNAGFAPFLDFRPLSSVESSKLQPWFEKHVNTLSTPEQSAISYAITHLVPEHIQEVRSRIDIRIEKTIRAVHERLTKEIAHWDHRAEQIKLQEIAGRTPKLNSLKATQRADDLRVRYQRRMDELKQEKAVAPQSPVVIGCALVIPSGLLAALNGEPAAEAENIRRETKRIEDLAMKAVMNSEIGLGNRPRDVSHEKCGYDIESKDKNGDLRFIEVKGRIAGASTITVTKNEILRGLNCPDRFILAIVEIEGSLAKPPKYIRLPFSKEPEFETTSVNFDLGKLLSKATEPL